MVLQILGTFIAQPYGITDPFAMKGTWFVVNISYNHEYWQHLQVLTLFK